MLALVYILTVKRPDCTGELFHKTVPDSLVDEYVIRCDAGLAGVESLAPGDAFCGELEVGGA